MSKLFTITAAALLAGASVAASVGAANAGGVSFGFGGGGWHGGHGHGWGHGHGGIYVDIAPAPVVVAKPVYYGGNAHVAWCSAKYKSYNPYTNYFMSHSGPKPCYSPYM